MLVDDNPDDNFFHSRVIKKNDAAERVLVKESAIDALGFLKTNREGPCAPPHRNTPRHQHAQHEWLGVPGGIQEFG